MIRRFSSFEAADAADRAFYRALTPDQRTAMQLDIVETATNDRSTRQYAFVGLLNAHNVDYLIAGPHAVAHHALPRYTDAMDIFVRNSNENAARLVDVIARSGFEYAGVSAADRVAPDSATQVGVPPYRVNLVTSLAGVTFDSAWNRRAAGWLRETPAHFLSRDDLIANKRAVAGPQDLVDLELVESTPAPAATR